MRQTGFPGILVESISVERPPFDEPGILQEFVGERITREFDAPKQANDLSQKTVGRIIDEIQENFGPVRTDFKIRYNLTVRVPKSNPLSKRSVRTRARLWTRTVNPFSVDVINVTTPKKDELMSGDVFGDVYEVTTWVMK